MVDRQIELGPDSDRAELIIIRLVARAGQPPAWPVRAGLWLAWPGRVMALPVAWVARAARLVPPRCKPQPKPQGPTGAAAQTWSVPGAQELSATNAIQHDRLGEAQVFTKPRRQSS
jgi:hypothetical protein